MRKLVQRTFVLGMALMILLGTTMARTSFVSASNNFALERLVRSIFRVDEHGQYIDGYSDEFAGTWWVEGTLYVGIVGDQQYIQKLNLESEFGEGVLFIQRRYSYNHLHKVKEAVAERILEYGVSTILVRESNNQVGGL